LQKAVLEAIESLKPVDASQSTGRSARTYQILTLRYVQGLDLAEVLEQLGVGESEYHRSQRRALEAVTLVLGERWGVGVAALADEATTAPREAPPAVPPLVTLPAARPPTARSFPLSLTSFVGRAREQAAILQLVRSSRLVTLTGPPGAGKTRVAQAVAEALRAEFGEERAFVPLGPIEDPQLVLSAIAKALGISEAGGRAVLDALIDGIGTRRIFLVLDNVEHVLAAAPLVAEVIAACPQLTVLATSRSPLKVHGEQEFAIAPLEVLNLWQPCSLAELASVASVALFRDRARAVGADFELTEENAAAISEICVRLDGIPLAIELAAARTKALAPPALLARLAATGKTELRLLNRGLRDLPARQQTMWAAIDWSYDLLAPVERLVFRRLSIFSGSFSLEAAEGIVSPTLASATCDLAEDEQLAPETILVDVVSTRTGTWRWPSGPNPSSAAPSRRAGSSGSSANTIICGQRSGGVSKTTWWQGCARRPASGASGGCVVTTTKVGAGWTSYWPRPFPR
jgi:predicted ATPase